jgi:hypothetical protein
MHATEHRSCALANVMLSLTRASVGVCTWFAERQSAARNPTDPALSGKAGFASVSVAREREQMTTRLEQI